jgi:hypothetical protein
MHAVSEPDDPTAAAAPPPAPEAPEAASEAEPRAPAAVLKPAQPEPEELATRPVYMPKIPWVAVLSVVLAIVGGYSFYQAREAQRADELRQQLLTTHEAQLSDVSQRYQAFRARLERWTIEAAAAGEPERHVDPRLRIAGLHDGPGLYLRVRASDTTNAEAIARGALAMDQDAITRCLGIAPSSARGLYEHGDFLMPEWAETAEAEHDYLRLRVIDEQLARHITADVPVLATLMQARYFLLVVQQGENRRDAPVDIFLWDIPSETQLLATRIQADGVLLPVSIRSMVPEAPDAPRPASAPSMVSGGANDCSIASQLKALTGEAPVEVHAPIGAEAPAEAPVEAPSVPVTPGSTTPD